MFLTRKANSHWESAIRWIISGEEFAVGNNGNVTNSYGREQNSDLNISPVFLHQFNKNIRSSLRGYFTAYNGSQRLRFREVPDSAYNDEFRQNFYRIENQTDINSKDPRLPSVPAIALTRPALPGTMT